MKSGYLISRRAFRGRLYSMDAVFDIVFFKITESEVSQIKPKDFKSVILSRGNLFFLRRYR